MNQKMFYHKVCLCIPVDDFHCLLFIWFLCLCSFIEESLSLYRPCLSLGALEAEICKQANKSSKRSMEGGKNLYILSVTVTWFLLKEQIDQTKGRFTESFREAWNWHYNLSSFQTAGNCKKYQKLKGKNWRVPVHSLRPIYLLCKWQSHLNSAIIPLH